MSTIADARLLISAIYVHLWVWALSAVGVISSHGFLFATPSVPSKGVCRNGWVYNTIYGSPGLSARARTAVTIIGEFPEWLVLYPAHRRRRARGHVAAAA